MLGASNFKLPECLLNWVIGKEPFSSNADQQRATLGVTQRRVARAVNRRTRALRSRNCDELRPGLVILGTPNIDIAQSLTVKHTKLVLQSPNPGYIPVQFIRRRRHHIELLQRQIESENHATERIPFFGEPIEAAIGACRLKHMLDEIRRGTENLHLRDEARDLQSAIHGRDPHDLPENLPGAPEIGGDGHFPVLPDRCVVQEKETLRSIVDDAADQPIAVALNVVREVGEHGKFKLHGLLRTFILGVQGQKRVSITRQDYTRSHTQMGLRSNPPHMGFDEAGAVDQRTPPFGNALESDQGFDRQSFQDLHCDVLWEIHYGFLLWFWPG
ncbi:hypothetical protein TorRG33x02_315400 [Trema orientale]|uniref:Uncharacterized protein n=1 Tax=Trema orientale TaxID=63057 RepID=A0A2P5BN36_TREOI|nr:hypothetical protein TorRG33x02_315400 [Trema orientale]